MKKRAKVPKSKKEDVDDDGILKPTFGDADDEIEFCSSCDGVGCPVCHMSGRETSIEVKEIEEFEEEFKINLQIHEE